MGRFLAVCALATEDQAAAAPPSSVMNSRRLLIRSPRRRGRAASAAQGRASSWSRKDLTLDHLTKDRLHVCLCKRPQRLRANISKGATAQSKRSHGDVIWCLDNRDDVVLAQCPEDIPHGRSALLRHFFEGVRPFR